VNDVQGFLPKEEPLAKLPQVFDPLEKLMQDMPLYKADGSHGLLFTGDFGKASGSVPDFTNEIVNIHDNKLLSALFRDYTFWASAYLLEPCNLRYMKNDDTEAYGEGRDVLPLNISSPLVLLAKKLGAKPFMEYAMSYALYNWTKKDPKGPMHYDNLQTIRTFSGVPSESAFILVHVTMVSSTPAIVAAAQAALTACGNKDREAFNKALIHYASTMRAINQEMETMWGRSLPEDYNKFRVFIMGTKQQPMFPRGVMYEMRDAAGNIIKDGPHEYRGESGANDSIIPTADNFLQLTDKMPDNPLTDILKDFRSYRPAQHNAWVTHVYTAARACNLREFSLADPLTAVHYLSIMDEVRDFRNRHWNFTKEYIIRRSAHPVATGGSPIIDWLPNQLGAVLNAMDSVAAGIDASKLPANLQERLATIRSAVGAQTKILDREVEKFKKEREAKGAAKFGGSGRGGCPM
jgi:indoleamine 2,3-dioxygenase